jgi:UDP-N-acetylglucosamine--N-acetylmuramyl-(pentapeptide) pyrophosphoryl-undecaprenol N-acetylglucosamine transferase
MNNKTFIFAGGGTGGHIYPAIAVAEQIIKLQPTARIHFFCSSRKIDSQILAKTGFEYTPLPARGLSARPDKLFGFCTSFLKSYKTAKKTLSDCIDVVVTGVGGFVAAPVCLAAHKQKIPLALLNIDIVPGRANKLIARWADQIFLGGTAILAVSSRAGSPCHNAAQYFAGCKAKLNISGCPLRSSFNSPQPAMAIEHLNLDRNKKILLITGASSGSENINTAICSLLDKITSFADNWQIVHLTGVANYEKVKTEYGSTTITHTLLGYYDDMPNLLAAADIVIGRSGAVSVAEYAAAAVPSICVPYPYHKDKHQYLNARKLVEAGAAVIVDDLPDRKETASRLWEILQILMKDDIKREQMKQNARKIANPQASLKIAEALLTMSRST